MKQMVLALPMIASAGVANADQNTPTWTKDTVLASLQEFAETCGTMDDGASRSEIFTIKITRGGNICTAAGGEIDPEAAAILRNLNLPWAGIDDDGNLWVSVTE